jgi:hypothetical protein
MDQETRWLARYKEVIDFIKKNKRNPSKYNLEHRDMYNWIKANRKQFNAGELKADRVEMFEKLMKLCERYKRVNQYK